MKFPLLAFAVLALSPGTSFAAKTSAEACPGGQVVTVRFSEIKPEGSKAGFDKAVADNQAWYAAHGHKKNKQVGGVVLERDKATGEWKPSATAVATVHLDPPSSDGAPPDEAWKAFVAGYDANSRIVYAGTICLSQPLR